MSESSKPKVWRKSFDELDKYSESGKWRRFRGRPRFCVATIDFGTTHCSVHYLLYPGSGKEEQTLLKLDKQRRKRVPNCILFDQLGSVIFFGYKARERYAKAPDSTRKNWIYFEHVKKSISGSTAISRVTKVQDDEGKEYFLVDVIAQILCYLKSELMKSINDHPSFWDKKPSDIDWVITVPAIWDAPGKQMIREAGYKAGMCSNKENPKFALAPEGIEPKHVEFPINPDALSIAYEPECAAIHCHKEAKDVEDSGIEAAPKCYMLVDIGGGTVDVTCHTIMADGYIEELCHPIGNNFGGTVVNESFQHFLEELVKDPSLKRYLGSEVPQQAKHKAHLKKMLYTSFEIEKEQFGTVVESEADQEYFIELESSFWSEYRDIMAEEVISRNQRGDMRIQIPGPDETQVIVTKKKMAEFFKPAIDEISKLLLSKQLLLGPIGEAVTTIYWIGGFGSSPFLRSKLEAAIKTKCGPTKYKFYCPPEPSLAVVHGATTFRCNPGIVQKRKANATYGVACKVPFMEGDHNPVHKTYIKDRDEYWCDDIFCTFVKVGDDISTNTAIVCELVALYKEQKTMTLSVYSSPRTDVTYTTEDTVKKLTEVKVQLYGEGLHRFVQITFDITHTEIQVRAYQLPQGKEVKIVVDFLTTRT